MSETSGVTVQAVAVRSRDRADRPNDSADREGLAPALTVRETSRALRLDPRTIRAMFRAGELEGNRRGHAIRISRESVEAWIRGQQSRPGARERSR